MRQDQTLWCAGCGVEIVWTPVMEAERPFCCEACQRGEACECATRMEAEEERRGAAETGPSGLAG